MVWKVIFRITLQLHSLSKCCLLLIMSISKVLNVQNSFKVFMNIYIKPYTYTFPRIYFKVFAFVCYLGNYLYI